MRRVSVVAFSFKKGGAAIAANNFVSLLVQNKEEVEVLTLSQDESGKNQFLKRVFSYFLGKLQLDNNPIKHSLNLFSYNFVIQSFQDTSVDLFHLHWINNDTLSVYDFDKIPLGSLVTLHDEWLYCGAEHYYKVDDKQLDFMSGYQFFKKGVHGVHWNYIIWRIKYRYLRKRKDLIYTVPSKWMLDRASKSLILREAKIHLLPNPIDTDKFKPSIESFNEEFREKLMIVRGDLVFLFGAIGGKSSFLKGGHLFDDALSLLSKRLAPEVIKCIKLINFGGRDKSISYLHGFKNISLGHIESQSELAKIYSCADCVVVPSMVESFGQVAAEALACETPVVCFNYSGLKDIVIDEKMGLLAKAYSVSDLAKKMESIILMTHKQRSYLGQEGRLHVIENFSVPVISKMYKNIINEALTLKNKAIN